MNTFLGYPVVVTESLKPELLREPIMVGNLIPAPPPCERCGKPSVCIFRFVLRSADGSETQEGEPLFSCQECLNEALRKS